MKFVDRTCMSLSYKAFLSHILLYCYIANAILFDYAFPACLLTTTEFEWIKGDSLHMDRASIL